MIIKSDGKVGIGTTNPQRRLSLYQGDSGSSYAQFINTTTGSNSGDGFIVGIESDESAVFWNHENTPMLFAVNNAERMRIDSTGNVGIGTDTPTAWNSGKVLHIHNPSGNSSELHLTDNGSGAASGDGSVIHHNSVHLYVQNHEAGSTYFYNNGSPRMIILAGGDVGIGTTTPQTRLQVNGNHSVFQAHIGQGQDNADGRWGGISLGYAENGNANYRKVGIAAEAHGDNAARQDFHILVDTANDGGSATLGDSKMKIDGLTGAATFAGTVTADNIVKATNSGSEHAYLMAAATGTGTAGMYLDASNGDFSGGDYFSINQFNDLSVVFESRSGAGNLIFKSKGSLNLTMNGANSTFAGTVTATHFHGDGSNLTGVTGEWDGTHTGTAVITGDLKVTGSSEDLLAIASQSAGSGTIIMSMNAAENGYEPLRFDVETFKVTASGGTSPCIISTSGLNTTFGGTGTFTGLLQGNNGITLGGSNKTLETLYNGTTSYRGALGWSYLQMGNNGSNDIIGGNTAAGGTLRFFTNNTNYCGADVAPNGTLALTLDDGGDATFTGKVSTGLGSNDSGFLIGANQGLSTSVTLPAFTNGVSNLAADITLGNAAINGLLEIELTSTYSHQNAVGSLRRKWHLGFNADGTIWSAATVIEENSEGPIHGQLYVSDPYWDSSASTYKIRVYHKVSTGNTFAAKITAYNLGHSSTLLNNIAVSGLLTSTSTTDSHTSGKTFTGNVNAGTGLRMYTDGSGNGVIYNLGQDKDLYLVGDDGGTGINALVFDMSNGGSATFIDDIDLAGSINMTGSSKVIKLNNGGFLDFDGTNLQFNSQRNPNTGGFHNTAKSHAHIGLQGPDGGSQIIFGTAASNNTTATTRLTIGSTGHMLVANTRQIQFYNSDQHINATSANDLEIVAGDDINYKSNFSRFFSGATEHCRVSGLDNQNNWIANGTGGKLGIGTAAPAAKLDVKAASNEHFLVSDSLSSVSLKATNDAAAAYVPMSINGSTLAINGDSNGAVSFGTGGATFGGTVTLSGSGSAGRLTAVQGIFENVFLQSSNSYATLGSTSSSIPIAIALDGNSATAALKIETNNNATFAGAVTVDKGMVVNEGSHDADFRVESNGEAYMLRVDGGNNRFGVATQNPSTTFHVTGTSTFTGALTTTGNLGVGTGSPTSPAGVTRFIEIEGTTAGIVLHDDGNDAWEMWASGGKLGTRYNNSVEGWWLLADGSMGVGTTAPDIVGYGANHKYLSVKSIPASNAHRPVVFNLAGQKDDGSDGYVSDINFLNMATNGSTINSRAIIRMSRVGVDNSNSLEFWTATTGTSTKALTLDSSQNATFAGGVDPVGDVAHDLGSATNRWRRLYAAAIHGTGDAITLGNDAGSWLALNARGINIGDWDDTSGYGEIRVGTYDFKVIRDDDTAMLTIAEPSGAATFVGAVDATNYKISGAQGSDGQVLTSTGSGVAWEDAAGSTFTGGTIANSLIVGSGGDSWGETLVATGTGAGWGSSTAFPYVGSSGGSAGSLIMLHNPHIPYRTDNERTGASGKAGIRMAIDAAGSSWWDMGLTGDAFEIWRNASSAQMLSISSSGNGVFAGQLTGTSYVRSLGTYQIVMDSADASGPTIQFGSTSDYDAYGSIGQQGGQYQFRTQSRNFAWLNGTTELAVMTTSGELQLTSNLTTDNTLIFDNANSTRWQWGSTPITGNNRFGARYYDGSNWTSTVLTLQSNGNFSVSGALSKGSGSFKIDHPVETKKDTHYLVHSFVEAPQADNIYSGKVDLVDGEAEINIDTVAGMTEGTFVALNTNVRCFTTNESNWDLVKSSVSGNKLTIESKNTSSTATISWMVIGERHDQHMKDTDWTDSDGKVIVEPRKEYNPDGSLK
jgi:hypothetical protein